MPFTKYPKGFDPFGPGGPHEGMRNGAQRSRLAKAKAEELGIDPFEVLLLIAAGDFQRLYPDSMSSKPTKQYVPIEFRVKAAAEAAKYIHPSLKSVEHTGENGGPLEVFMNMGQERLERRLAELESMLGTNAVVIEQASDTPDHAQLEAPNGDDIGEG